MKKLPCAALAIFIILATGCGTGAAPSDSAWTQNVYRSYASFENYCAQPRTGIDPSTGSSFPDLQGSRDTENLWIRSWVNATYLWYSEVADVNPSGYSTLDYFKLMKTTQTTTSGHSKDRFHFTYPTTQWYAISQSGTPVGYGIGWALLAASPPRNLLVAFSQPNAPTGLARGAQILSIDGVDAINGSDVATLNAGLYPTSSGESHVFVIKDTPSSTPHSVTLVASALESVAVQNINTITQPGGTKVGYILFTQQEANAEKGLIEAINTLSTNGITDLVLDLRYNGGGFVIVASEAAYMIAGPTVTSNKVFEGQQYNDKIGTGTPVGFQGTAVGFTGGAAAGTPLPFLGLTRVFVLTTGATCSASESIINGLRGIGVQVLQFGSTTCGKPYAFFPTDNCGTTYFSIQIKGINDAGFGDYPDGFTPANSSTPASVSLPGCAVTDDFTHELGDPNESILAAALQYRLNSTCPVMVMSHTNNDVSHRDSAIQKPAILTNKFLR